MSANKVILITGGSSGIGFCCVQDLVKSSPDAIIINASRTAPAGQTHPNVHHVPLDLASRDSVSSLVRSWSYGPISALLLNAGMTASGGAPKFDADGVEVSFAVNHVNQALLFLLLKEKALLASRCRIVFVTTALHDPKQPLNQTPPYWTDAGTVAKGTHTKLANRGVRYSTSKLGTIYFAYATARRVKAAGSDWTVTVYEPGFVPGGGSRLQRDESAVIRFIVTSIIPHMLWFFNNRGIVTSTPPISGKALADIATRPEYAGRSGEYILLDKVAKSSEASYDETAQEDLWKWTIGSLAKDNAQARAFEAF